MVSYLKCNFYSGSSLEPICFGAAQVKTSNWLIRKNSKKSSAETKNEDLWIFVTCNKNFDQPLDRVMESASGADHFCAEWFKKPPYVYGYMSQTIGIRCCDPCTTKLKKLIKEVDTTTQVTKMKSDLKRTVNSVKTLMDDFYYFISGTKVKGQAASQSTEDSTIWKQQLIVAKLPKEIILEVWVEQKREEEDEEEEEEGEDWRLTT